MSDFRAKQLTRGIRPIRAPSCRPSRVLHIPLAAISIAHTLTAVRPFIATENALPEIWSLGHRNMQAAALDGEDRLCTVEHGPWAGTNSTDRKPGSTMDGQR